MKIGIMTDLEGVCGVNGRRRDCGIGNKIINEEVSQRLLTEEVNAVAEGLLEAGAKEIIVVDGHGGSNSILIENLHPDVQLRQTVGGLNPITGLNSSFSAEVHLGTHAMMGVRDGFLNHTFNSHAVIEMRLNEIPVGEVAIDALIASYFNIPTIMVSGDTAACREAVEFLGKVNTVETKKGLNRYTAINRNPADVRNYLRNTARDSLLKLKDFPLKKIASPYELKIQLMCPNLADDYEQQGAERLDYVTILLKSDDFLDLWSQRNGWAPGIHNGLFY